MYSLILMSLILRLQVSECPEVRIVEGTILITLVSREKNCAWLCGTYMQLYDFEAMEG